MEIDAIIKAVSDQLDADILAYYGPIGRPYDDVIIDMLRNMRKRKNILLAIDTRGGELDAAYRISRCIQEAYKTTNQFTGLPGTGNDDRGKFIVFVDGLCKSAGTLICLAADVVIMSGNGQMGPIDTQMKKYNEVGELDSGLTPIQAVNFLENQSVQLFRRHFSSLRFDRTLAFSSKMGAEIASKLTADLLSPIYQQIDPMRLAEVDRLIKVAHEYGKRLSNGNLKEDSVERLLASYPSHAFVIDRKEAREIFNNVEQPTPPLRLLGDRLRNLRDMSDPFVRMLTPEIELTAQDAPQPAAATSTENSHA